MRLAVNYSPEAEKLIQEDRITFDLFKTPPWEDMIVSALSYRPVYVHFDLVIGEQKLKNIDWGAIDYFLEKTGTRDINLHLSAPNTLINPSTEQLNEYISSLTDEIYQFIQHYTTDRILVENTPLPLRGRAHLRAPSDPGIITRIAQETGCRLLLDISHARITATSLGIGEKEYISQMPLDRLQELHVTGLGIRNGDIIDHLAMSDSDWISLDWALERIQNGDWAQPDIVAFEYGGTGEIFRWRSDKDMIASQVPRLYRLIHP